MAVRSIGSLARVTSRESSSSSRSSKLSAAGLGLGAAGAAQHVAHARQQLLEAERLGDVVVAAGRQPADLVLGRVARGQEDDRRARALGAEPAGDLEALHVGEHHVQHDQVGTEGGDRGQRFGAGARGLHGEALEAQGHRDDVDDVGLVVDDQHAVCLTHRDASIGREAVSFLGAA